jgi:orotate phosphoribosyltransferase
MEEPVEIFHHINRKVSIKITRGHFATNHSHVNYYIDLTDIKTQANRAREAAKEIAKSYAHSTHIDTIICLEGTEVVGAFLAEELTHTSMNIDSGNDMAIIVPETNSNNQLIFKENIEPKIQGKHILLLVSTVSTGKTINRSVECIQYYGGNLVAVSSLFSAVSKFNGIPITALFTNRDCPNYLTTKTSECPYCQQGRKIDAIVNGYGYQKI